MSAKLSGSLTGTGASGTVAHHGPFSSSITGTFVGTVALQRSLDQGSTWGDLEDGWTDPTEKAGDEPAYGVLYRFNCSAFTSGSIDYVLAD